MGAPSMIKRTKSIALGCAIACATTMAHATPDEDRVLASLKEAYPHTRFTGVSRTPVAGLYEVWMGENLAFVSDKNTRYLLFGRMWDAHAMQDITAPKLARAEQQRLHEQESDEETPAVSISRLPLADAMTIVKGKGERNIVVFSDPACAYCKRLEPELAKLDNVTIHTFLVPFQGTALPIAIWCARDRANAWHRYMIDGDTSLMNGNTGCRHPIERNLALAQRFQVRGTPTLVFANGRRIDGYASAAEIEAQLAAASGRATTSTVGSTQEKSQ
jgi:thiol:disulfide interchange protein DsbC